MLQSTPYTWTWVNHVEWSRLTNSSKPIRNVGRVMDWAITDSRDALIEIEEGSVEFKCGKCNKTTELIAYDVITNDYLCRSCVTNLERFYRTAIYPKPQLKIIQGGKK